MTSREIIFGAVVVVVATALSWFLIVRSPSGKGSPSFGAVGNLLAENYIPYVRSNGGYNSADPIQTTSTLTSGAFTATTGTFTGLITGTTATLTGLLTTSGGQLYTNVNATTTAVSTTLKAADINAFDTVLMTPTVGNITVTFPASSTVATFLPAAGNMQRTCFENSTTTAATYITFAGGTGFDLQVASSSATALGSAVLGPQKVGCFTFVRGKSTPTTFDIHATYSAFQ